MADASLNRRMTVRLADAVAFAQIGHRRPGRADRAGGAAPLRAAAGGSGPGVRHPRGSRGQQARLARQSLPRQAAAGAEDRLLMMAVGRAMAEDPDRSLSDQAVSASCRVGGPAGIRSGGDLTDLDRARPRGTRIQVGGRGVSLSRRGSLSRRRGGCLIPRSHRGLGLLRRAPGHVAHHLSHLARRLAQGFPARFTETPLRSSRSLASSRRSPTVSFARSKPSSAVALACPARSSRGVSDPRVPDVGDVEEDVLRAVVRLNEAVALGRVEPLHGADGHGDAPFMTKCRPRGCRAADQASRGNGHRARRSIPSEEGRPK